ncbi:MAG: alpha/beta hydrolase, partial [Opitutaceae bacterium]
MLRFIGLSLLCLAVSGFSWSVEAGPAAVQTSLWNGFQRLDFVVAGRPCLLVLPANAAPGRPWIWRTEFFGHEPQADLALLARGWHVGYMDAKHLYGGPQAMAL